MHELQIERFFINALRIYVTYYLSTKIVNEEKNGRLKKIIIWTILFIMTIVYGLIRNLSNFLNSMLILFLSLTIIFAISNKSKIGYSLCIMAISLSISYILYYITIAISYIPGFILRSQGINNYTNLIILMIIYILVTYTFLKIKRFKNGFIFLQDKIKNDYFDILILNIGVTILFITILIVTAHYELKATKNIAATTTLIMVIMFVTIQKSLKLYYKQKMLIKDLNETKEELENKKKEVEQLEKENLNFSKISHSIAHKQKSLEYKINKLMLNNEISTEIDLKDKLKNITKELNEKAVIELSKTNIEEIDDMLSYMQSECIKNKIDFQLQINGNIHHMINKYIHKEKLEILLADLIKNAIIAINYSENTNKSILVRLGIMEGTYSLYVYDSGIEFELDTLENIGKKPSTTHSNNGGTGMGMMNIFDTLKQYNASMIINEYGKPKEDNFTKVIQIMFDKKDEFKIISYRQDKIRKTLDK